MNVRQRDIHNDERRIKGKEPNKNFGQTKEKNSKNSNGLGENKNANVRECQVGRVAAFVEFLDKSESFRQEQKDGRNW